ncbi:hypothetical protein [Lacrimispora celerecrescens]|uniref:hypothetical protein n=1 Tax=Lacrimispora celerecrescens TaxID=29354 RepID=UPI001649EA8A|nr:hypothetical protein [Lacrimispora celerecrescens]
MESDIDPLYGALTVIVVLVDRAVLTYLYDGSLGMEIRNTPRPSQGKNMQLNT